MDKATRITSPRLVANGRGAWSGTLEDLVTSSDTEALDYFLATRHGDVDVAREDVYDLITSVEDLEVILDDPNVTVDTAPGATAVAAAYDGPEDADKALNFIIFHPAPWGAVWHEVVEGALHVTPMDSAVDRFTLRPGDVLVVHTAHQNARPTFWAEEAEAFHHRYQREGHAGSGNWDRYTPR